MMKWRENCFPFVLIIELTKLKLSMFYFIDVFFVCFEFRLMLDCLEALRWQAKPPDIRLPTLQQNFHWEKA